MDPYSQYLANHRFAELFIDELGWDRAAGTIAVDVDERHLSFKAIAQKRGFHVLHCMADRRVLFNRGLIRRAQQQISKTLHEHLLIYSCNEPAKQVWQWSLRLPDGRRLRHREHPFFSSSAPETFVSRVRGLRFSLDDEADVTLVDALDRVRAALDVTAEMNLFAKRPWYAERSDELATAMKNGQPGAFHKFILLHRPLARHLSKWLQKSFKMDAEDAEQIGIIGLLEAARRFNPDRGFQFSTYATYWVRQACQRYGPDAALLIRLPAHIRQSFIPFQRQLEALASQFGPSRANDELVRHCMPGGWFFQQWLGFQRALNVRSLSDRSEPEFREARSLADPSFDLLCHRQFEFSIVRRAIDSLRPRDRRLVRLRHGFEGRAQTLEEIGKAEGLTRERVRQIVKRAEEQLRQYLRLEFEVSAPNAPVGQVPVVKPTEARKEERHIRDTVTWLEQFADRHLSHRQRVTLLYLRHRVEMNIIEYRRLNRVAGVTARRELLTMAKKGLVEERFVLGYWTYRLSVPREVVDQADFDTDTIQGDLRLS